MGKCVDLPISQPMFYTYGFQAITTAVFDVNPTMRNWAMNSLIFLRCNPDFLVGLSSSPEVFMSRSGYNDCPYIERTTVSLKFIGSKFQDVIHAMLDDECYVYYSNIDNSVIRKKYPYHGSLYLQSGVICGYNDDEKSYCLLSRNKNQEMEIIKIPQKWLELGRKKSEESGECGFLCAMRPKTVSIELNVDEIYRNLKEYTEADFDKYPPFTASAKVYGSVVHDYLGMYLNYLLEQIIPFKDVDREAFRQLWEHKKCMLERLITVEDKLKMDHRASNQYTDVVKNASLLMKQYDTFCKNKEYRLLLKVREQLLSMKDMEQQILRQFISDMERKL